MHWKRVNDTELLVFNNSSSLHSHDILFFKKMFPVVFFHISTIFHNVFEYNG